MELQQSPAPFGEQQNEALNIVMNMLMSEVSKEIGNIGSRNLQQT